MLAVFSAYIQSYYTLCVLFVIHCISWHSDNHTAADSCGRSL